MYCAAATGLQAILAGPAIGFMEAVEADVAVIHKLPVVGVKPAVPSARASDSWSAKSI
jgi:hypothetical protein